MNTRAVWMGLIALAGLVVAGESVNAKEAAEPTYSDAYQACLAKANSVDFEMAHCAGEERERQDKALNLVYRQLTAKLDPNRKSILVAAERAWVTFRDAQCEAEASGEAGGTLANVIRQDCLLRQTYDRVLTIKDMLKGEI
jgi:uncharacterized protein YecT (DUF1311 family)